MVVITLGGPRFPDKIIPSSFFLPLRSFQKRGQPVLYQNLKVER